MKSETQAKWFYIDDFFKWFGCKFITCDKDTSKKPDENIKANGEKSLTISKSKYLRPIIHLLILYFFNLESNFDSNNNSDQKSETMRQEAIQKAKKIKEQMEREEEVRKDLIEKKRIRDAELEKQEKEKSE